jgi:hypothetical protein
MDVHMTAVANAAIAKAYGHDMPSASHLGVNEERAAGCQGVKDKLWGRCICQTKTPARARVAPPMAIIQKYLKFLRKKRKMISAPAVKNIMTTGKRINIGREYCIRNVASFLVLQVKYNMPKPRRVFHALLPADC